MLPKVVVSLCVLLAQPMRIYNKGENLKHEHKIVYSILMDERRIKIGEG
jgi:hypothetical protein